MVNAIGSTFDVEEFLTTNGPGRKLVSWDRTKTLFRQGDLADSVFYLLDGCAIATVVSAAGKRAIMLIVYKGQFIGEEALAEARGIRAVTVTSVTACTALKIRREEMIRALREESAFHDFFLKFLLERIILTQANLADQLFNSSEKRLARALLMMAESGKPGQVGRIIPKLSQEALGEMIGATRSRVSLFMRRFRKSGLIDFNGHIEVRESLRNVMLGASINAGIKPVQSDDSLSRFRSSMTRQVE
ncbi:MAG: Crp/Fnr family transcriptional regulator [Terracidiphilus sp.]|jgi:CRP-like cAMP-binding protein